MVGGAVHKDDIAWAAGLFEGEGCISFTRSKRSHWRNSQTQGRVSVAMTDQDVVERFAKIMGFGTVEYLGVPQSRDGYNRKATWRWRAQSYEHVQATIAMFWSYLGTRRKARAKEILSILQQETVAFSQRPRREDYE
jgi:hypothetical protein